MTNAIESRAVLILAFLAAGAAAACDDALSLLPATYTNVVDTVTLYAIRGTPVAAPSGYDVPTKTARRTDQPNFDFAFDLNTAGTPVLYPAGSLGLGGTPGILPSTQVFDSIKSAPTSGYLDSLPVTISPGAVFIVRSRPSALACSITGALPLYGKFLVLAIDPVDRTLKLQTLVNRNCGYRDLTPGLPTA